MHVGASSDGLLHLTAIKDADSRLQSNGLGYGDKEELHTGKLKRSVVLEIYNAEIDHRESLDGIAEIAYRFNVPYEKVLAIKNGEIYSRYTVHAKAEVTMDDVRDSLDLMYTEYDKLELEHDGLRVIYDELQVEKDELQGEKVELEDENEILQMENSTLLMVNDDLKAKLKFQNRKLTARIKRLETLLRVSKEELDS